jgi:inner membrane protein
MASTVGHALCGVACLLGTRLALPAQAPPLETRSVVLFALLANLPDLDLALGLAVGDAQRFHGGATHSIAFAAATGLIAALALRGALGALQAWLIYSVTVLSHVAVDGLLGPQLGWHASLGARYLWPFIEERVGSLPLTVLLGIRHGDMGTLLGAHNARAIALELLVLLPVVGLMWKLDSGRQQA